MLGIIRQVHPKRNFVIPAVALALTVMSSSSFAGEDTITYTPVESGKYTASVPDEASAQSRLPMLKDFSQLPQETQEMLQGGKTSGVQPQAYGSEGHPFTTKRGASKKIIKESPWSGVGKLWMRFGTGWYVCSASVVDKGLVVTAAHCVHDYGQGSAGWADEVLFEPARYESTRPLGTWKAINYTIPTVYYEGTDTCTTYGVVCENDVAILTMENRGSKYVGTKSHIFNVATGNYSYTSFAGETAAQMTQLGYPVALDGGWKIIRTDSLGYQATPSNVVIGSDQTGGSSGGPWLVNFGMDYVSQSTTPTQNAMAVMAVTSWGWSDPNRKVQGASRFSTNTAFPTTSNIETLHNAACAFHPTHCY